MFLFILISTILVDAQETLPTCDFNEEEILQHWKMNKAKWIGGFKRCDLFLYWDDNISTTHFLKKIKNIISVLHNNTEDAICYVKCGGYMLLYRSETKVLLLQNVKLY